MTAPPIKLRSPAELLAVVPHLLGFEPQHAIVVMALRDSKIDLTERIDLPAPERVEEVAEALSGTRSGRPHTLRCSSATKTLPAKAGHSSRP
jgi:hypothetical protein